MRRGGGKREEVGKGCRVGRPAIARGVFGQFRPPGGPQRAPGPSGDDPDGQAGPRGTALIKKARALAGREEGDEKADDEE